MQTYLAFSSLVLAFSFVFSSSLRQVSAGSQFGMMLVYKAFLDRNIMTPGVGLFSLGVIAALPSEAVPSTRTAVVCMCV